MPKTGIITINGKEYLASKLSKTAKDQITNIKAVDAHIKQLQQQLAIAQAARSTYVGILQMELPTAANA